MFEITDLKAKKLPELQELAKSLGVPKYRSLKKLDLVYKILDHQASKRLGPVVPADLEDHPLVGHLRATRKGVPEERGADGVHEDPRPAVDRQLDPVVVQADRSAWTTTPLSLGQ